MNIAEFKRSLFARRVDRSRDCAKVTAANAKEAWNGELGNSSPRPDSEAIDFYLRNHVVSTIASKYHEDDPLTDKVRELILRYHDKSARLAARTFFYLLLICTREVRHAHSKNKLREKLVSKYGEDIGKFITSLSGSSSDALDYFCKYCPEVPLGEYTDALRYSFSNGVYSGGYGGPAWAKVARTLNDFVQGKISAEMMVDTAFTLAHNNGPIFNKGMLFQGYTPSLIMILDVQRAGLIPQLIWEAKYLGKDWTNGLIDDGAHSYLVHANEVFSETGNDLLIGHVDWHLVELLGAVKSYNSYKAWSLNKYGKSATTNEILEKHKADAIAKVKAEAKKLKHTLNLAPGVTVTTIRREELAN